MKQTYALSSIIIFAILSRLALPPLFIHLPNFSAIDALALFCGAYCNRRSTAIIVTLLSVWLSDILLTHALFYPGWYWQYGCYVFIALLGSALQNKVTAIHVAAASLCSATLFFVISNFGVWVSGTLYPLTIDGLMACYLAAIPFFQYSLLSDLIFSGVLFGSMALFSAYKTTLSHSTR